MTNGWLYGGTVGLCRLDRAQGGWQRVAGLLGTNVAACLPAGPATWFVTTGFAGGRAGLARFSGGAWERHEAAVQALGLRAADGTLCFAGEECLYLAPEDSPGEPLRMPLPVSEKITGVVKDADGALWVGAGGQVYRYQPRAAPPGTLIEAAAVRVPRDQPLRFELSGRERFVPAGGQAKGFRFAYRVDGGQWRRFSPRSKHELALGGLALGQHLLEARAQNESLQIDPAPARLAFTVLPIPLQERGWFWPALSSGFGLIALLSAALAVARRKLAGHARELERTVQRRTASLSESERKLRAIFNQTFQFSGLLSADGRILAMNESALTYAGVQEAQVLGRLFWEAPWWQHSAEAQAQARAAVERAARGEFVRFEAQQSDAAGDVSTFDFSVKPVRDESGRIVYLIPESRDVTETKRLEAQLAQAQKMEAVGRLAGGVAHDFNNLLTVVISYCDLVMADLPEGHPAASSIREIRAAGERAAALTRQLLAFSRQQMLQPRLLDLNELLRSLRPALARRLGESVTLEFGLADGLAPVEVDLAQMEQVIFNLASNALEAMPQGGCLRLETAMVELGRLAVAHERDLPAGRYVRLRVSDTGCGMDEATLNQLFEPFFTTKDVGKGPGLGLATAYGIIRQHDGGIQARSELGKGSAFDIYLHAAEGRGADAP